VTIRDFIFILIIITYFNSFVMKQKNYKKGVGRWTFLSLLVLFLCAGLVNANAQPPKKAGAKKSARYSY
jgi:hypothetical protein